jgi:lysophospholipase L1-like esterase
MSSRHAVAGSALFLILVGCGGSNATGLGTDGGSPNHPGADSGPSDATTVSVDATNGSDATGVPPVDAGPSQSDADAGIVTNADANAGSDSSPETDSGGDGGPSPGDGGPLPSITVWLAGDSTVANGDTPCPVGWGKEFGSLFESSVTVVNSAVGGTSIRSWLYNPETTMDSTGECVLPTGTNGQPTVQAHWQAMLDGMKSGDYLFIQFGINDGTVTCPRHVGIDAFMTSLGVMADAAKMRGAQPIFVTPVSSIACMGNTAYATRGSYATATKQAATQDSVPLLDLETLSVALYNSSAFCPLPDGETDVSDATPGPVGAFFCDDHTHFETTGAIQIAGLVATAVRNQAFGLASYLK